MTFTTSNGKTSKNVLRHYMGQISKLEVERSRLREANALLNDRKMAAERAAAEIVDQKMVEVRNLKYQLLDVMEERERLQGRIATLNRLLTKKDVQLGNTMKEWALTRETLRRIRDDLEDSDKDSDQMTLRLLKIRDQNYGLKTEGLSRKEVLTGSETFQQAYTQYRNTITTLEEMLGSTETFDFLRQKLLWAETKLRLFEDKGQPGIWSKEDQMSLRDMERDLRFREASARAQYISFKARLITDELDVYSGNISKGIPKEMMKQVLDRLAWILQNSAL